MAYRSTLINTIVAKVVKKLQIQNKQCGLMEMKKLEAYYRDYQLTVINNDGRLNKEPIFIGEKNVKFIYISYTGSHYNVIKSMAVFLHKSIYCNYCKIGYNNRDEHRCATLCKSCNRSTGVKETKLKCEFCQKICSNKCKILHETKMCKVTRLCEKCGLTKKRHHICIDEKFCKNCNKSVVYDHKCFILTEDEKKDRNGS